MLAPKVSVLAAGTSREYNRADFILGMKLLVRLCMIKRVGHAWSGADVRLKFNAKEGPGACTLIWQFFLRCIGAKAEAAGNRLALENAVLDPICKVDLRSYGAYCYS